MGARLLFDDEGMLAGGDLLVWVGVRTKRVSGLLAADLATHPQVAETHSKEFLGLVSGEWWCVPAPRF